MSDDLVKQSGNNNGGLVPRGYPSPQTEVNTAREVGFHTPLPEVKQSKMIIDLPYESIEDQKAMPSLKDIGGMIWDAAKPMFDHGRSEIAAALFTGSAYVMYQHSELEPVLVPDTPEVAKEVDNDRGR